MKVYLASFATMAGYECALEDNEVRGMSFADYASPKGLTYVSLLTAIEGAKREAEDELGPLLDEDREELVWKDPEHRGKEDEEGLRVFVEAFEKDTDDLLAVVVVRELEVIQA